MRQKRGLVAVSVVAASLAQFAAGEEATNIPWEKAKEIAQALGADKDALTVEAGRMPIPKGSVTLIREYTYQAGEGDNLTSCREKTLQGVQRLAIREIGTAVLSDVETVQSEENGTDFSSVKDRLITLAGGIATAKELEGELDGKTLRYHVRAEIRVDPEEVRATLRNIVQEWSRNRATVLEKLAAVEVLPPSAQGAIFTNDNFLKCVEVYSGENTDSRQSWDSQCIWENYGERAIDYCKQKFPQAMTSAKAADRCLSMARTFPYLKHANFDRCMVVYYDSTRINRAAAAEMCVERIQKKKFLFVGNPNFDSCFSIYARSLRNAEAADICIKTLLNAR